MRTRALTPCVSKDGRSADTIRGKLRMSWYRLEGRGTSATIIDLHTHYTSGVASMTYLKAVEAGCEIIDCAMSPLALGTSQPATEVMVETFAAPI